MQIPSAVFGFCLACLFSLALTPLVRRVAKRGGLRDLPGDETLHRVPLPHVGGLAIYGAMLIALVATMLAFPQLRDGRAMMLKGLLTAGGLVVILGFIDDIQGSSPWKKLSTQCIAVLLLQLHFDVLGLSATAAQSPWLAALGVATVLPWMLGMTNAMNLIDGLDGLASGVAAISGMGMMILAMALGQPVLALVAAVLVGACLGFLRSNAHPAKIFMGDTGSMFLGFVLAAVGAGLFWVRPSFSLMASIILITWVPAIDIVYAVIRRWARHENIFRGDMGHIHHRLLNAGFSHRSAGLSLCGLSVLGAVAGIQAVLGRHGMIWACAVLLATMPLVWILRLGGSRARAGAASGSGTTAADAEMAPRVVSQERAA